MVRTAQIVQNFGEIPQVQSSGWGSTFLRTCSIMFQLLEIPELQFLDTLFMGHGVLQHIDKVVDVPVMQRGPRGRGKIHDCPLEGEPGSRVAPGCWAFFQRACIWQRTPPSPPPHTCVSLRLLEEFHIFYVDSARCPHMEIWTLFQSALRATG